MRTIKFRGRSRKTGEWLVGDLLQVANEVFIAPSDGDWFDFIPWTKNNVFHLPSATYQVIPATVGQFTGLHDKNGKEIYEGDIVSTSNYGKDIEIGNQIKNVRGSQLYEVKMLLCNFVLDSKYRSHYLIYYKDYEVIGNIHDNPELLNPRKGDI